MIARENGMRRALSGTGGARSSAARSPTCCRSLRSSSLALRNFALSAQEAATFAWRARIVSKICCVVTLFPSEGTLPDGDQVQEEEAEDEDAQKDIRSSSFSSQRITSCKFKELRSSGQLFSLFVVSFV